MNRRTAARLALALAALAGLAIAGRQAGTYLQQFAAWVDGLGAWGPTVFIAGYMIATVAFVPGSLMTLAAGAIFGLPAVLYVFAGGLLGSSAAFLVSRHLARSFVERALAGRPRFAAIDRAIATRGWRVVVLLRLSPIVPFNLLNYALGLTRVRFADYALASVGMIPGTILYVYYGKLAGDVAALAGAAPVERGAGYYAVLLLGLAATVTVATLVNRAAQRALREATGD